MCVIQVSESLPKPPHTVSAPHLLRSQMVACTNILEPLLECPKESIYLREEAPAFARAVAVLHQQ